MLYLPQTLVEAVGGGSEDKGEMGEIAKILGVYWTLMFLIFVRIRIIALHIVCFCKWIFLCLYCDIGYFMVGYYLVRV